MWEAGKKEEGIETGGRQPIKLVTTVGISSQGDVPTPIHYWVRAAPGGP